MRRTGLAVAFVVLVALALVFLLSRPAEVHAEPEQPGPASQAVPRLSPPPAVDARPARPTEQVEPQADEPRRRRGPAVEFERVAIFDAPDGVWRFAGLPAVVATVTVVAPGFLDAQRELTLARGEERDAVDFALERGLSLSGTVFDAQTRLPLAGATIRASGHRGKMRNGQATSDSQGAFRVEGLPAGRIDLNARSRGYRTHEVTVEAGQQGSVRIELSPSADSDPRHGRDYEGVGMQFESTSPDAGRGYRVSVLHPEGGARVAGVEVGDEILAADGVSAFSVPTREFLRQIKGAEGTVVTLEVRRGERVFELHAVRRRLSWER